MSVLIKGMAMPKNCGFCPFCRKTVTEWGSIYSADCIIRKMPIKFSELDLRDGLCPLVELKDNDEEEWRDVDGYGGNYQVSNLGRVKNKKHIMNQVKKQNGYMSVALSKYNKKKYYSVHRLVAMAFVKNPNPQKFTVVNHKDEDRCNNNADNLEWCTQSYNLNYGTYPQRNSEQRKVLFANRDNNWKCRRVVCVEDNASYRSAADASEHYHIDRSSITKCCKGKRSTAGGYHWEYDYSY